MNLVSRFSGGINTDTCSCKTCTDLRLADGVDSLIFQTFINRGTKTPIILATLGLPWQEVQVIARERWQEKEAA